MDNILKITSFLIIVLIVFSSSVLAAEINEIIYEDKEFRNPFIDYEEPEPTPQPQPADDIQESAESAEAVEEEPVITFEMVRNELPFSLSGIISSNKERIALLNTGEGTEFIRGYYKVAGYELLAIREDSVIVRNRGFRLRLKIGGEIDEI